MDLFLSVFGYLVSFHYTCLDRIVINAYLQCFLNTTNVVFLFREILGYQKITKDVLSIKTIHFKKWIEEFIFDNGIPFEWAEKKVRKEAYVKPHLDGIKRNKKFGVYFVFKSMEQGTTYRAINPKFQTEDKDYMIIRKTRSRFTHYYFYILDEILGAIVVRVASFFPFNTTCFMNGHCYIEQALKKEQISFNKKDNAFISVSNLQRLHEISDSLSADTIRQRLDYWTNFLTPRFSKKEKRFFNLNRFYSIAQIELCRNFIFKRNFPIRKIFERSCELGLIMMTNDKISQIFGQTILRHFKGKLQTLLDKADHGHHVFRAHFKNSFIKQYEKLSTLLRNELVCNDLRDFKLKKSLDNLPKIKELFKEITDRFAHFQAHIFNNHFEFSLIPSLAKPVTIRKTKIAGIKLENKRMIRLMQALLHSGSSISVWRTKYLHRYILEKFRLKETEYTLNQLRYDVRKLKVHGLVDRIGRSYQYRLTDLGKKASLIFVLFHKKLYGPIANSLFNFRPNDNLKTESKFEKTYRQIDRQIDKLINLMAA
ncbi:MAG: hypothetical protein ACXADW_22475 [Candidatus Hodarchaeales archaeon]